MWVASSGSGLRRLVLREQLSDLGTCSLRPRGHLAHRRPVTHGAQPNPFTPCQAWAAFRAVPTGIPPGHDTHCAPVAIGNCTARGDPIHASARSSSTSPVRSHALATHGNFTAAKL